MLTNPPTTATVCKDFRAHRKRQAIAVPQPLCPPQLFKTARLHSLIRKAPRGPLVTEPLKTFYPPEWQSYSVRKHMVLTGFTTIVVPPLWRIAEYCISQLQSRLLQKLFKPSSSHFENMSPTIRYIT